MWSSSAASPYCSRSAFSTRGSAYGHGPFLWEAATADLCTLLYKGDTDLVCNFLGGERFREVLKQLMDGKGTVSQGKAGLWWGRGSGGEGESCGPSFLQISAAWGKGVPVEESSRGGGLQRSEPKDFFLLFEKQRRPCPPAI